MATARLSRPTSARQVDREKILAKVRGNWLDRAFEWAAPRMQVERARARLALALVQAQYDAATTTRRGDGFRRWSGDANATLAPSLAILRDRARDLVRNNGHARRALNTICDQAISYGITPAVEHAAYKAWANSTDCDADGVNNMAGIQRLVMRTMAESGEVLVRRRWRRPTDGLPIPMQLQVLEPDFLDTTRDQLFPTGARIVQGVEFSPIGKRVAYWLYPEHPGSRSPSISRFGQSQRVPASEVAHIYDVCRPGQVRGPSWFAAVLMRIHEYDKYSDATLMKQLIAACLGVFRIITDGADEKKLLGKEDPNGREEVDALEPGLIHTLAPGEDIHVVQPPSVTDHESYTTVTLREIAAGLDVNYEDMTGDYTKMPFSAARMSRLRGWARVMDWRWRILEPLFLNRVWTWAMQGALLAGEPVVDSTEWTAPPLPMIEPDKEGLAIMRNIRAGILTFQEAIRERGYNVEQFFDEYARGLKMLDDRGIVLDSDARKMTQAGQAMNAMLLADAENAEAAQAVANALLAVPRDRRAQALEMMKQEVERALRDDDGEPDAGDEE